MPLPVCGMRCVSMLSTPAEDANNRVCCVRGVSMLSTPAEGENNRAGLAQVMDS